MKYSLKDKQFKKRNHIFGDRKHYLSQQTDPKLNQIQELPHQSEESQYQIQKYKHKDQHFFDFEHFQRQEMPAYNQYSHNSQKSDHQFKTSKHGLIPNTKPNLPFQHLSLIQTSTPIRKPKTFHIQSHVVDFHYQNAGKARKVQELKQYIYGMYRILMHNNEKISLLETAMSTLFGQCKKIIKLITPAMIQALSLQKKIDVFSNTMRNVYQELRISRLKQQNLELYFKQSKKQVLVQNKNVVRSSLQKPELNQFLQLLQYESEKNSFDNESINSYNNQPQAKPYYQKNNALPLPHNSNVYNSKRYEEQKDYNLPSFNPHKRNKQDNSLKIQNNNHRHSQSNHTTSVINSQRKSFAPHFESYQSHFSQINEEKHQKLSPFQANNHRITNENYNFYEQKTYENAQWQTPQQRDKSNEKTVCYNNKMADYNSIKRAIQKKGQAGLRCWMDEMGCLRRANSTYIFDEKGQVVVINKHIFNTLLKQGYIRQVL